LLSLQVLLTETYLRVLAAITPHSSPSHHHAAIV
jgi:hypothetical protein